MMPAEPQRRSGRPRKDVPPEKAAEVVRLWHRRMGRIAIAKRTGLGERQVREVLAAKRLSRGRTITHRWTMRQDDCLTEHVGEWGVPRLAREVSKLGPTRTEGAVRRHLSEMGLTGFEADDGERHHVLPTLRMDLTIEQAAAMVGRDIETLRAAIEARPDVGASSVSALELRALVLREPGIVDWVRAEHLPLVRLLAGELAEWTIDRAAEVVGRDPATLIRRIRSRQLSARREDGAWRVWPSELRDLIARDKSIVDRTRVEDMSALLGLCLGELGTGDETKRKAAQRARKAERDEG